MPSPTPVAETYVSCVGSIFNIGGTFTPAVIAAGVITTPASVTGGVNLVVMEGGYKYSYEVADMTNNQGSGWSSDVKTIASLTGSFKVAYELANIPPFAAGQIYAVNIFNPGSSSAATGNVRFNNLDVPIIDIKNGLIYGFDIKNQGVMVITN